jgi:hypothetical protein
MAARSAAFGSGITVPRTIRKEIFPTGRQRFKKKDGAPGRSGFNPLRTVYSLSGDLTLPMLHVSALNTGTLPF